MSEKKDCGHDNWRSKGSRVFMDSADEEEYFYCGDCQTNYNITSRGQAVIQLVLPCPHIVT